MHIVVCINHIPDPEAPARQFKLDDQANRAVLDRVNRVIGPFDENALETALKLKDTAGARVTALSVGPQTNQEALKKALALRCDAAVLVKEDAATRLDSAGVARVLAAAIGKLEGVDLVLCGRQVGDWDSGQVGQHLAEELGFTFASLVREVDPPQGTTFKATREVPRGIAVVEVQLPAVATITNTSANQLRIPKVKDVMAAHRTPITTWGAADLGVDMEQLLHHQARVVVRRMALPEAAVQAEIITGENDEEVAEKLARRIVGLKVL